MTALSNLSVSYLKRLRKHSESTLYPWCDGFILDRSKWLLALVLSAALAAGWLFSCAYPLAALTLPAVVGTQRTAGRVWLSAFAYYAAAGKDILHVGHYLHTTGSAVPAPVFWLVAAALQSTAWALCTRLPMRITLASVLSAVLPLGMLSWGHPWHAAGIVFPGTALIGLLAFVILLEAAGRQPLTLLALLGLALIPPSSSDVPAGIFGLGLRATPPPAPPNWAAVNTNLGDVFHHPNQLGVIEHMTWTSNTHPATVIVWPESMVPNFNDATIAFWPQIAEGKTIVFGGTLAQPGAGYRNVVLFRGREEAQPVDQRVPVPAAMWQPLSGGGVPLSFSTPIRSIGGHRAAFLVCYEQLLAWSYLQLLLDRPTLLVASANVYWVRETSIPAVQTACLRSWAALLRVPYLQAVNQ